MTNDQINNNIIKINKLSLTILDFNGCFDIFYILLKPLNPFTRLFFMINMPSVQSLQKCMI